MAGDTEAATMATEHVRCVLTASGGYREQFRFACGEDWPCATVRAQEDRDAD